MISKTKKYFINNFHHYIKASLTKKIVNVYWWDYQSNFGDLLTPLLIKHYGYYPFYCTPDKCDLVCIGSVLQKFNKNFNGTIIGTGFISSKDNKIFDKAKIRAVRGHLTWEQLGRPEDTVFGDPGILSSRIINIESISKNYALGIVPHYKDFDSDILLKVVKNIGANKVKIIDVKKNPNIVINNIAECSHILSSSLHGIIVADSYKIPSCWIRLSDNVTGNGFKFIDYNSAFNLQQDSFNITGQENLNDLISRTNLKPDNIINDLINKLDYTFKNYFAK